MAVDARAHPDHCVSEPQADTWYTLARELGCSPAEAAQWALLAARQLHYPTDRQEYVDQLRDHMTRGRAVGAGSSSPPATDAR